MGLRFALDMGTNSIGWAVWRTGRDPNGIYGEKAPLELKGAGVRIFKDGRNPKDGQSLATMRRVPRQARKRRDRFVRRRADLMQALIAHGLMPAEEDARKTLAERDPYELRARGLDTGLSLFELGRAIFHLNQRRGFRSNRKTDKRDKDKGKIAEAGRRLEASLATSNCRTFGEFLWMRHRGNSHDPRRARDPGRQPTRIRLDGQGAKALYEYYPTREMLRHEFDRLWRSQAVYHPELDEALRTEIERIVFYQRPLKRPKVGNCTFEHAEQRLPKALVSVQAREIYERLSHLRLSTGPMTDRPLLGAERDALASALLNERKLTFVKLRKALKLGSEIKINYEEAGETELAGLATNAMLAKDDHFGGRWRGLPYADKDKFIRLLLDGEDEETLISVLMASHGLSRAQAENCASIPLPDGYSRLGPTANAGILDALVTERQTVGGVPGYVIPYSEAVKRAGEAVGRGWHHSDERDGEVFPSLPYYGRVLARHILPGSFAPEDRRDEAAYYGRLTNPTVHIGLNQLRRVVNALIAEYGPPDEVVVELARELKLSSKEKERRDRENRDNRAANLKRAEELLRLGQLDTGENRARLKLYEEQLKAGNGVALCPFSGRPISLALLFSSEIEVEHILPRSRSLDDSAANKILCFRDQNRRKRGRSPYEAFGDTPEWEAVAARAQALPPNKRWRFRPDALDRFKDEATFLDRQMNETRYLSRLTKAYLSKICDFDHVYVTPGTLVGLLRGKWGLNSLLADDNRKDRTDHRHHAIDAIVIGALTRALLQQLAHSAGQAEKIEFGDVVGKVPWPFEEFRNAVREKLESLIVSYKPEHGKTGALHEDTAYGFIADEKEAALIGNAVRRKPLADLTANEVDGIRDTHLRESLQARIAAFRDAKGKIRDDKSFKAALAEFGREQGLRRIRVAKAEKGLVPIHDRRTGLPYKAVSPGENHHMDIVRMRDGSWRGFAASVFEVNQKGWRPQWERDKLGGKLVMRLHKGDLVEVGDADGQRRVKVVIRLSPSNNILYLASGHEGGDLAKRHNDPEDPFRWDFANIGMLRERECRQISIGVLGVE